MAFDTAVLKAMRKKAQLSQKDLGKAINMSRESVTHIETGKEATVNNLRLSTIRAWHLACKDKLPEHIELKFKLSLLEYFDL